MTDHPDTVRARARLKWLRQITVEQAQVIEWLRKLRTER